MKLIIRENTIRLIDIKNKMKYTIQFSKNMISFYEGHISFKPGRIYVETDENGYINNETLLNLFKLRGIEGKFGFYNNLKVRGREAHVLDYIKESIDPVKETYLFLNYEDNLIFA